ARALAELVIQKVNAAVGDGRSRVAGVDGSAPANLRAASRKCFEDARLAPDSVALRAEPLRPVIGVHCERPQRAQQGHRRKPSPLNQSGTMPAARTVAHGSFIGTVAWSCSQIRSRLSFMVVNSRFCPFLNGGVVRGSSQRWISAWPSAKVRPPALLWK